MENKQMKKTIYDDTLIFLLGMLITSVVASSIIFLVLRMTGSYLEYLSIYRSMLLITFVIWISSIATAKILFIVGYIIAAIVNYFKNK